MTRKARNTSIGVYNKKFEDNLDPDLNSDRFKNRRRMAWVSLFVMIFTVAVMFFWVDPADVEKYSFFISALFSILAGIVLTYMGTSSFQYNSFLKHISPPKGNNQPFIEADQEEEPIEEEPKKNE